ncbi:MAG: hypothetical protein WA087_00135 [Candidatus Saccharimonadales bacterium]
MTLLKYLQFQEIDPSTDDIADTHRMQDDIALDEQVDEDSLEKFWDEVVDDIHHDPEWFTFADE